MVNVDSIKAKVVVWNNLLYPSIGFSMFRRYWVALVFQHELSYLKLLRGILKNEVHCDCAYTSHGVPVRSCSIC